MDGGRPILEAHTASQRPVPGGGGRTRRRSGGSSPGSEQLGLLHSDTGAVRHPARSFGRPLAPAPRRHGRGRRRRPADWVGWVELTTEPVDELAMQHTAMVMRDVAADVLGVVEAEDRITLQRFSTSRPVDVGGRPYEQVMVVDGNDDRGIDVGLLAPATRRPHPHPRVRPDDEGVVFSRDCCEYHLRTPGGRAARRARQPLQVEGLQRAGRPLGNRRRRRQATRVAEIYGGLRRAASTTSPSSATSTTRPTATLAPLLQEPTCATSAPTRRSTSGPAEARSAAATRPASSTTSCCHRRCSPRRPAAPCSARVSGTAPARRTRGRCTRR